MIYYALFKINIVRTNFPKSYDKKIIIIIPTFNYIKNNCMIAIHSKKYCSLDSLEMSAFNKIYMYNVVRVFS